MFLLYAIAVGLVLGLLTGGRPANLGRLQFAWAPLAVIAFAGQLVLFSPVVTERVGDAGPWLYVLLSGVVLVAVGRNIRVPGLAVVVLGGALNLAAIAANGGFMPATADAFAAAGRHFDPGYSNSAVLAAPALAPLIDRFAMPIDIPLHNVFSVGDVLIGVGAALALVLGMQPAVRPGTEIEPAPPADPGSGGPGPHDGASAHMTGPASGGTCLL